MAMNDLTGEDLAFILESLRYTKRACEDYDRYPDENFRREKIARADEVIKKVRALGD